MHQPTPSLFNVYADALVKNGWRPLPGYQDTKRPSIKNWNQLNDRQWNHAELLDVMQGQGQREGKMVCLAIQKELVAIDIDVEDEAHAAAIQQMAERWFGKTPLRRFGRYPRCVLIYRSDGSVRSQKHHPIEIYSGTGQVVGFGFHAGAGREYEWDRKSPLELAVNDPSIPIINVFLLKQFLSDVWTIIPRPETKINEYKEAMFRGDDFEHDRDTIKAQIDTAVEELARSAEGHRNEDLFHAAYVLGRGIAAGLVRREEYEEAIKQAAVACGLLTEDTAREVASTFRSGIEKGNHNPVFVVAQWFETPEPDFQGPKSAPEIPDHDFFAYDDDAAFTLPAAIIKGVLPKTGVAFIGGQSGAGKTFLAVDLAVALTTGQPFFGRKVKERVGIAILAGEGAETLKLRIQVAREARNVDRSLPIAWAGNLPNLSDPKAPQILLPRLRSLDAKFRKEHGVRLGVVILDTLAATFLLENENDNSEASKVIKVLQNLSLALGVLCVPVHHYGKGAETGLRGASAWRAGSDAVLSVTADRNQQTGLVSGHSLWLSKSRVGEEGPLGAFVLRTMAVGHDEDGDEITSCYVVPEVVKHITAEERMQGEELLLCMLGEGTWRESPQSGDWAGLAVGEAFGLDATEKGQLVKIKAILKRLHDEGKIRTNSQMDEHRKLRRYVLPAAPLAAPPQEKDNLSEDVSVFE